MTRHMRPQETGETGDGLTPIPDLAPTRAGLITHEKVVARDLDMLGYPADAHDRGARRCAGNRRPCRGRRDERHRGLRSPNV
jgi:hypothetical protein